METPASLEEIIQAHPFLVGIPHQFNGFLSDCACLRRFGWHQQIFAEGGEADHFYLILTGKVTLETSIPEGGRIVIQTLGSGDALGWSWLFPPHRWRFRATTIMPTDVLSFAAEALRKKAAQDPAFAHELLNRTARTLVQRLQAARDELVHLHRLINQSNTTALSTAPL